MFEKVTKEIAHRGQEAKLPGVTKEQALQHFAVVLDGQLITVPSIDFKKYPEGIDASTGSEISGGFTITSAQSLASELQSGALPIKLSLISRSQVSASLGKQALSQGVIAMIAGFAIVCLFLLLFYRFLGMIAVGGLLIYGAYSFALVKLIPVTLTLPGIAGLILTIGVAADANIVIFERVKEEIRGGRSIVSGIATGYKHGFAAIVDANVVTFMTAFILFALATAEVKGFAFMLGIGVLVSLFTAVLATQAALGVMSRSRFVTHPSALGAGRQHRHWTFDFMGASKWFFSMSGTILLIGALAIGGKGLNFGIDFKSGTRIQTAFIKPVSEAEVAKVMTSEGFPNAEVQKFTNKSIGGSGYQISTKTLHPEKVDAIERALETKFGKGPRHEGFTGNQGLLLDLDRADVRQNCRQRRGDRDHRLAAGDLRLHRAALRVEVRDPGADRADARPADHGRRLLAHGEGSHDGDGRRSADDPGVLALRHDHRVRPNTRERAAHAARRVLADRQPLDVRGASRRSLATSFCTLLPVLALLLFGGETLKDFAFALMIGIASGAYSSIFIASPVLTHWKEREAGYRTRRARIVRELGAVPAYATTAGGAPEDVEPTQKRRRTRSGSLVAPEQPGQQLSRDEFQELVRDLGVEEENGGAPAGGRKGRSRSATAARPPPRPSLRLRHPSATLPLTSRPRIWSSRKTPSRARRAVGRPARNKRHGRSR